MINKNNNIKIYFIGIGGIGMSGLAQIMNNMGFTVQGSDLNKNKNTDRLIKTGIKVYFNHQRKNLNDATIVIISSAITKNNKELLAAYLKSLMLQYLNPREFQVLRLSYGLDCDKHSAKDIAPKIGIKGPSSYVRVSELKKQAVRKLIENVDHSQVIDYL